MKCKTQLILLFLGKEQILDDYSFIAKISNFYE